jgi:hypothetical protein
MSKLLTALTKDGSRSLIIGLVAAGIIFPLVCISLFLSLTIADSAGQNDTSQMWLLPVAVSLSFLVIMGVGLTAFVFALQRPANWIELDSAFTPLGLTGHPYLISGRQYQGVVSGRQVNVYLQRRPMLSIHLETPLSTKLSIGQANQTGQAIARTFGRQPMAATPGLEELVIYPQDETWATLLVTRPDVQALLRRLVLGESNFPFQQVHLQPGNILLRFYRSKGLFNFQIPPEAVRQWFDDLLALATIAESLPAPQPPK